MPALTMDHYQVMNSEQRSELRAWFTRAGLEHARSFDDTGHASVIDYEATRTAGEVREKPATYDPSAAPFPLHLFEATDPIVQRVHANASH